MKTNISRILCLIMAMAMVFALCACGDKKKADDSEKDLDFGIETEAETEVPENKDNSTPVTFPEIGGGSSSSSADEDAVAAYVEAAKEQIGDSFSDNDMLDMEIAAEGTAVVYKYAYKSAEYTGPELAAALEEALDEAGETFTTLLSQMKNEEPAVSAIIVEYYDAMGNLLASKTFR